MQKWNGKLESLVDRAGWGLFLILIGMLFFVDNKGWLHGTGWFFFAIGLGCIFVMGGLARYFIIKENRWKAMNGLVIGLALVYVGAAFLLGFGDWWPLALVPVGFGYLAKGLWGIKQASISNEPKNTGISV
jgi:hypothetical protein